LLSKNKRRLLPQVESIINKGLEGNALYRTVVSEGLAESKKEAQKMVRFIKISKEQESDKKT
jgi:hypothetical protein